MFHWYSKADKCIIYLDDLVPTTGLPDEGELLPCRWFTRSWTLQKVDTHQRQGIFPPRHLSNLTNTTSFYHPQAHLLTSSINFKWDNPRPLELGFKFATRCYPEHLWDSQRLCFLTSKFYGFTGLVEIKISAPNTGPSWEGTCFVSMTYHIHGFSHSYKMETTT
ncbi:hypothetical protein QBC36DRAFT_322266 [Triangularia setosa]|uniref:Uncharacterized protein n=1 Tax=Triangularia setosa TaxID=2587417 RepID=A0AAN6WCT0_9PEZI|nr:hypothetical protein QBC36DRAFT_322266 [Podospora setosa]